MNNLYLSQTEAQRAIAKHINAYPLWTVGMVSDTRWGDLVTKFSALYGTDLSPSARQWRKHRHECCAHLIGAPLPDGKIRWVLLVTTSGDGEVKHREQLHDAHSERLVWGDYVLVRSTRASALGGGTRWTWFLAPPVERREANYLTKLTQAAAAAQAPLRLTAFTNTLLQRPMHSGVRAQIAKMLRRAQKVWAKHSSDRPWPGPDPSELPHVGRYRSALGASLPVSPIR